MSNFLQLGEPNNNNVRKSKENNEKELSVAGNIKYNNNYSLRYQSSSRHLRGLNRSGRYQTSSIINEPKSLESEGPTGLQDR